MSKVALSVDSPSLDTQVLPRLDRSAYLLLVDPDTMAWESVGNPGLDTDGEVRIAETLGNLDVSDVVSGDCGRVTRNALREAGISIHRCDCGTTARRAIQLLVAGELPEDFWR
jgi:predicted Fe-Mo cluster-binding NifX family protein